MTDLHQHAPYPKSLASLIQALRYKKAWKFTLDNDLIRDPKDTHGAEGHGTTLIISIVTPDSYDPSRNRVVNHYFIVPAATYNVGSWQRWLLDCILKVEQHEACEFFTLSITDDQTEKPFAPLHGPGEDPYRIVEYATDTQRRTSFRGELNE